MCEATSKTVIDRIHGSRSSMLLSSENAILLRGMVTFSLNIYRVTKSQSISGEHRCLTIRGQRVNLTVMSEDCSLLCMDIAGSAWCVFCPGRLQFIKIVLGRI